MDGICDACWQRNVKLPDSHANTVWVCKLVVPNKSLDARRNPVGFTPECDAHPKRLRADHPLML